MPGETRNYTFKLPVDVSTIDTIDIYFYQDGEKLLSYDESMTDKIYGSFSDPNILICTLPREDTLKFENKIRASVQIEWSIGNYHTVAKEQRISVANYLNKEYL